MGGHDIQFGTQNRSASDDERIVKSDETLIDIIEYLKQEEEANLTEIADELGLANSSVHRHLATLKYNGLISQESNQYRLGLRFLEIGEVARECRPVYRIAQPKISRLAEETGDVACCVVEENNLGIFLCLDEGEQAPAHDAWSGKPMHLHYLSAGLCMMAFMPEPKVQEIIAEHGLPEKTPDTITDHETLYDELEMIREQGFYVDNEESVRGLSTVSVPVLDESNSPVAGLTVGGPRHRFTENYCQEEILPALQTTANEIELDIKFSDFH